ncbi:MAG: lamin tail domain-containing protein [Calditrichia bacterium]
MPVAILILLLTSPLFSQQLQFSEVMFDPIGSEQTDEFIEFYNGSSMIVDLNGWSIADSLSSDLIIRRPAESTLLHPGEYMLLFDASYFEQTAGSYDSLIPASAVVAQIDGATFGSGGLTNSRSKTIFLIDALQDTITAYRYSKGNAPGFSDEKIDLAGSDLPENWSNSANLNGTPGFLNSRAIREIDLSLKGLTPLDSLLLSEQRLTFALELSNRGRLSIPQAELLVFQDSDRNELFTENEMGRIIIQQNLPAPGDSLTIYVDFENVQAGRTQLCVQSKVFSSDTISSVTCWEGVIDDIRAQVVINEIMAVPEGSREEWVEIVNAGINPIDLSTLSFSDASNVTNLPRYILLPDELVVLCGDQSAINDYRIAPERVLVLESFPSLNNASDNLFLSGLGGWHYDRVEYAEEWFRREVDAGISLEKFNPKFNGKLEQSWSASVSSAGHSAGLQNSIYLKVLPETSRLSFQPNPFSPDGDGLEDVCLIRYRLPETTAFVALRIYDLRGRLVQMLLDGNPSASEGDVLWDGKDSQGRAARSGVYIVLMEAINQESGALHQEKRSVVLVRR